MHITLADEASTSVLQESLRHLHAKVANLRGPSVRPRDRITGYFNWVNEAVRMLSTQVRHADVTALVLTRRYELLLSSANSHAVDDGSGFIHGLLQVELDEREVEFQEAMRVLSIEVNRWVECGMLVMADTTFYITHPDKLADIDVGDLVGSQDQCTLIVPIVVIDELDGLKQSKSDHIRWRAGHTLGVLDAVSKLANRAGTSSSTVPKISDVIHESSNPTGIRLLFDPPNHIRLPINDDEIVARAMASQPLAGRKVTLVTYDTGQSTRAREKGLPVMKLDRPVQEPH